MKVLFAGLGSIGQRHARNLRTILGDSVELLAYRVRGLQHIIGSDLQIDTGIEGGSADVEERLGLRVFRSLDAALAEKPDAVFVTNPNHLHMPVALAAARAGCHLFIEKPLSHTMDGVAALTEIVQAKGLVCLVGYHLRFHPAVRQVQAWLAERAIGSLVAARLEFGEYLPGWHPYEDYRQMHAARRDQGGGVVLSQIHDLDCAFVFFGLPRRIFALGGHLSTLEIDVEDTASILMECVSDGRGFPVHLHQDYVRRPRSRTCQIIGNEGTIRLGLFEGTCDLSDAGGRPRETLRFDVPRNELFMHELAHFLACIADGERPLVGIREAAQSLRMACAAAASIEKGSVVSLS